MYRQLIEELNKQLEEVMLYYGLSEEELLNGRTTEELAYELFSRGLGVEDLEKIL